MLDKADGGIFKYEDGIYKKYIYYGSLDISPMLDDWKNFSYQDYLYFIDEYNNNRLHDIVYLRATNPLKYYENLVNSEYDDIK